MAKTCVHAHTNDALQRKSKLCRGCPMAKTYIHVMQIPLYSENLNYAEVAQWRKPTSMICKYRFIAKT